MRQEKGSVNFALERCHQWHDSKRSGFWAHLHTRPRGFSCECSQTPRFLYTRNAELILGGPGNVRFVKLSTFIILACAIPASAHSPTASGQAVGRGGSPASKQTQQLPKSCLAQQHPSEQINALLETIRDHPTAGAYNTLGALFAQDRRTTCAIAAFEGALRLEPGDLQADYKLCPAGLTKGDPRRAASEIQAAILQKPHSVDTHF